MKGDINSRQNCIARLKQTANMELYKSITKYGNKKLRHLWDISENDVLKVMTALQIYCIDEGEIPNEELHNQILLRQIEWQDGEGRVRIMTWAT